MKKTFSFPFFFYRGFNFLEKQTEREGEFTGSEAGERVMKGKAEEAMVGADELLLFRLLSSLSPVFWITSLTGPLGITQQFLNITSMPF